MMHISTGIREHSNAYLSNILWVFSFVNLASNVLVSEYT